MTFPTIPTAAAGRVLVANQADTVATRTFPDLSGLTKNSGDLLIAIVTGYQSSATANAVWSGWSAGWTEFVDQSSATTMAIGAAYKWSTGSETGTISVTEAATITGHASMILLSIPGSDGVTAPQATAIANGTAAAATLPTLTPSWGAQDTLWIAVGANGETSGTGSWTGVGGAAPTNYGSYADTATADTSTVGQTELAVAFRQLNATSDGGGTFGSTDTSNARNSGLMIAVAPAQPSSGATSAVTASITADGVVLIPGGGSADRGGRYGRSVPAVVVLVRNPPVVATPGQGDAALTVSAAITGDGSVFVPFTGKPVIVGQAVQQALFYRAHGTPYPALVGRASSADSGAGGGASVTTVVSTTAGGVVDRSTGSTLAVTAGITAAGSTVAGYSGSATLTVTTGITAAGVVAANTGSTLAVTDTITAAGTTNTTTGSTLAVTAGISAGGVAGSPSGASLQVTDTITATGATNTAIGATLPVTTSITHAVAATGAATRPTTVTITAAGSVTVTGSGSANPVVTTTITAAGVVARYGTTTLAVVCTPTTITLLAMQGQATRAVTATITATGNAVTPLDGVPVKNPGTVLTIPIPGIALTMPDTTTALTVPAARTELT